MDPLAPGSRSPIPGSSHRQGLESDNLILGTEVRSMAKALTATEVARGFADVLNRVAYRRESFVIVRGQRPVAELRPVPMGTRLADLPALLATLPRLDDAEAFATDLDAARVDLADQEPADPWAS
jgi:hypothetical protein